MAAPLHVVTPPAWPLSLRWAVRYLPDYFQETPCRFHVELFSALEDPDRRLIARVAPRGHAKSTCATFAYPLWCLCTRRRRNIVIVTHETSLATQFVRDIRNELESNERIAETYGDLCAGEEPSSKCTRSARRRWTAAQFTTHTGVTVQARSTGAGFRGLRVGPRRPDLIICDDIEKDEHVATAEGRQKLEHWLRRVVMPALAPEGQLVVVGSLLHHDSLLANLRDPRRFPRWDYALYRALEAERGSDGAFRRVALWPARWPVERLDLERERIGTHAFEQEYQANPQDDDLRVFPPEWLRRYDPATLPTAGLVNLITVDPATGKSGGDYFALWVGSVDPATRRIYTRELLLARLNAVEQARCVLAAYDRWRPLKIAIETTAYQSALKDYLEEESRRRGLYLPLMGFTSTVDKRVRITASSLFYENGTFWLPPTLDPEAERQFLHFPKTAHDDAPDVCAMGIELARAVCAGTRVEGATAQAAMRGDW